MYPARSRRAGSAEVLRFRPFDPFNIAAEAGHLALERRLSSSSGEGAKNQEADWWVQDQKVWIASRNDEQAWREGIGVTEGKGGWIVSVSGEADYERVRRNALLKNAGVIPGSLNPLRWDLAVAFETEAVARQAAGSWVGSNVAYWPSSEAAVVKKK